MSWPSRRRSSEPVRAQPERHSSSSSAGERPARSLTPSALKPSMSVAPLDVKRSTKAGMSSSKQAALYSSPKPRWARTSCTLHPSQADGSLPVPGAETSEPPLEAGGFSVHQVVWIVLRQHAVVRHRGQCGTPVLHVRSGFVRSEGQALEEPVDRRPFDDEAQHPSGPTRQRAPLDGVVDRPRRARLDRFRGRVRGPTSRRRCPTPNRARAPAPPGWCPARRPPRSARRARSAARSRRGRFRGTCRAARRTGPPPRTGRTPALRGSTRPPRTRPRPR